MASTTGQEKPGPGSFPLSPTAELLELDALDISLNSSSIGTSPRDTLSKPHKPQPGHYRATLLLDGNSCSRSNSNSVHHSPAASADGSSAQPGPSGLLATAAAAAATAAEGTLAPALPCAPLATAAAPALLGDPADTVSSAGRTTCAAPCADSTESTLHTTNPGSSSSSSECHEQAGAAPTCASATCLQHDQQAPAALQQDAAALDSSCVSSTGTKPASCPGLLQLPDFAAFMLPEQSVFAESSMDDTLVTPTPHTPVVPSIFAGDSLSATTPRTCQPHYSSNGGGSSTSSSLSGGSSNNGGSSSDGAAAGGPHCTSSNDTTGTSTSSSSWQFSDNPIAEWGTCRVLLTDEGDDFALDPFPSAVPASPSSAGRHSSSNPAGRHQVFAGLEALQALGSWEPLPFTSLLCRRTLSTVSEAANEGIEDDSEQDRSSSPGGQGTAKDASGAAEGAQLTVCLQQDQVAGRQQQQDEEQEMLQAVQEEHGGAGDFGAAAGAAAEWLDTQQGQQGQAKEGGCCEPLQQKAAPADECGCVSPLSVPGGLVGGSSGDGSPAEPCATDCAQQQQQQQVEDNPAAHSSDSCLLAQGAGDAGVSSAAGVDISAVLLELPDSAAVPHLQEQQQQCAALGCGQLLPGADGDGQQLSHSQVAAADVSSNKAAVPAAAGAEHSSVPAAAGLFAEPAAQLHQQDAIELPWQQQQHEEQEATGRDKVVPGLGAGEDAAATALGSKLLPASSAVAVTATAGPAAAEDEWEQANRQHLQQLQQQQERAQQVLSYPAAEAQLLAAVSSTADRSSSCVEGQPQQLQQQQRWRRRQQEQQHECTWLQRLQRLLACSCTSMDVRMPEQQQQQQLWQVLQLARTPCCSDNSLHLALLQAIYQAYTGCTAAVPRCGVHWAQLGFQGDDPSTDLRGAGMLGLLQLLYLAHHNAAAAGKVYSLSRSDRQEFPLAVVSFNITTWALTALRSGRLDKEAHCMGGHLAAANRLYCGAMYEFYNRWLHGGHTMLDSGFVLKQLEQYCRCHTGRILQLSGTAAGLPAAEPSS